MYVATRPCVISGVKYLIGETVDASTLDEKAIAVLIKRKVVFEVREDETLLTASADKTSGKPDDYISVPVIDKDEKMTVFMSAKQIAEALTAIQSTADEAIKMIDDINSEDELIFIHRLDSRKTVKTAAKEKAESLAPSEVGGDE